MQNLITSQLLSEEAFKAWLEHPATLALKAWLVKKRETEKERWADGDFVTADPTATAIRQAGAIGQCKLCAELLALEYEQLVEEEESHAEHERVGTTGQGDPG